MRCVLLRGKPVYQVGWKSDLGHGGDKGDEGGVVEQDAGAESDGLASSASDESDNAQPQSSDTTNTTTDEAGDSQVEERGSAAEEVRGDVLKVDLARADGTWQERHCNDESATKKHDDREIPMTDSESENEKTSGAGAGSASRRQNLVGEKISLRTMTLWSWTLMPGKTLTTWKAAMTFGRTILSC